MTLAGALSRLGFRPSRDDSPGCAACGHPWAMHSNGRTPCKAFSCTGGPSMTCRRCGGTTRNVASGQPCKPCRGTGSVPVPCQGFTVARAA